MRYDSKNIKTILKAEAYKDLIAENISIDALYSDYPYDHEMIDGIAALMLEVVMSRSESMLIASNRYPAEIVKSRILKLNSEHIRYVMKCMKDNTTKVSNIRKYMLASLFNAPITMGAYYQAEVNYDMSYPSVDEA